MAATGGRMVRLAARRGADLECAGNAAGSTLMDLSALQSLRFLHPAWLAALLPLWVLVAWLALRRARDGGWSLVIDSDLLPAMLLEDGPRGSVPWWLFAAV